MAFKLMMYHPIVILIIMLYSVTSGSCETKINAKVCVFSAKSLLTSNEVYRTCAPVNPSATMPDDRKNATSYSPLHWYPQSGCSLDSTASNKAVFVSLNGYQCTLKDAVTEARKMNVQILILISNTSKIINFDEKNFATPVIVSLSIPEYLALNDTTNDYNISLYYLTERPRSYNLSHFILSILAVACVAIGSIFGVINTIEFNAHPERHASEQLKLPWWSFIIILAMFCSIIMLLYFAYNVMVWIFIVFFTIAAPAYMELLFLQIVSLCCNVADKKIVVNWKKIGISTLNLSTLFLYPVFLTIGIVWCVYRKELLGVILQDILGASLCIYIIGLVSVNKNLKFLIPLMCVLFLYDIFFVFVTPLFTSSSAEAPTTSPPRVRRSNPMNPGIGGRDKAGESIMEQVATGSAGTNNEVAPMVFKIPSVYTGDSSDNVCWASYSILGFGDIVIPGIYIGFLHIFDVMWSIRFRPYFTISMIGYTLGIITAYVMVIQFRTGQPALLYIIPFTLVPILILGAIRGDLKKLWHGTLPPIVLETSIHIDGEFNEHLEADDLSQIKESGLEGTAGDHANNSLTNNSPNKTYHSTN